MAQNTKDSGTKASVMEKERQLSQTAMCTWESSRTISSKATVRLCLLLVPSTQENSARRKCTERACSDGPMVTPTTENSLMASDTDSESTNIPLEWFTRDTGSKTKNTARRSSRATEPEKLLSTSTVSSSNITGKYLQHDVGLPPFA